MARRSDYYFDKEKRLWRKQVTIDGKRKVFSAKTKQDVMLKILAYQKEKATLPTIENVADNWREEHWKQVREGSLRSYNAPLKRIVERFGPRPIDTVTPRELQQFINDLSRIYAQKTVQQHKIILNMLYKYAQVDMDLDIDNQASKISVPSGLRKYTRGALSEEQKSIISNPDNSSDFILPFLIYWTGTRCGEALALQFQDIDFEKRTISINKQITHRGNKPYISPPKTQNAYRVIPLLSPLEKRLKSMNLRPTDYLTTQNELPLTKSALAKRWLKWCSTHDLLDPDGKPSVDRHTIRHQYATILYEAGIEAKSAQLLLGHSDIRTTMDIYTHISQEQFRKDFALLEQYTLDTHHTSEST